MHFGKSRKARNLHQFYKRVTSPITAAPPGSAHPNYSLITIRGLLECDAV